MMRDPANQSRPRVLVFAGNDPTGGAGIAADIEAIGSQGCQAMPVITSIAVQDSRNVQALYPLPVAQVVEQARAAMEDLPVDMVKIGLLGSAEIAAAIADLLASLPVVLDPVLAAGGGKALANAELREVLIERLLPRVTVLTPNLPEARALSGRNRPEDAARRLLQLGCRYVLLTGTHNDTPDVIHSLYGQDEGLMASHSWPRLPAEYHGSGCTLAAALAANLAKGEEIVAAAYRAQHFTWHSLWHGTSPGHGQSMPNRWFWREHGAGK